MDADSDPMFAGVGDSFPKTGMTVEQCQGMIQKSLRTPMVKFLKEQIAKAGCTIGDDFIKAIKCVKNSGAGGYQSGTGVKTYILKECSKALGDLLSKPLEQPNLYAQIIACSNELTMQDDVTQLVIHELIHVYDECRSANLDWHNIAHQACSEIRANHLSGDCHFKRELARRFLKIRGHEQECVKRRSMKSVRNNPSCSSEAAAKEAMEAVWDICYNDTKPFDRAP